MPPVVFISYSRQDRRWKDSLTSQLGVLEREGLLEIWNDDLIRPGADWLPAIETAMAEARVAVFIVSADFLNSDFIRRTEIPALMERRRQEGLRIIPVIARPCPWQQVSWLAGIQARPRGGKTLAGLAKVMAEDELSGLAEEILQLVEGTAGPDLRRPAPRASAPPADLPRQPAPRAPAPPPGPPGQDVTQPLGGWAYAAISVAALLLSIWLLDHLISNAGPLGSSGLTRPTYYSLLVVMGLAVAIFLFGAMRSRAVFTGTMPSRRLELAGPPVIVALVVIGGFLLASPIDRFNFTVRVFDEHVQPVRAGGSLSVYLSQAIVTAPLTPQGEATFKEISRSLRGLSTRITAEVKGYRLQEPLKQYRLDRDVIEVTMVPDTKEGPEVGQLEEPVIQLVPGWGVFKDLPELTDPSPSSRRLLRVKVGTAVYEVPDLRRQTILLGSAGAAAKAAHGVAAMAWLNATPTTNPAERSALEALSRRQPLVVPTTSFRGGEVLTIEFIHGTTTEHFGSIRVNAWPGIQPILLALWEPGANVIPDHYPRVSVIVRLQGRIFGDIPGPEQLHLRHEIAVSFANIAGQRFPSMVWVVAEPGSRTDPAVGQTQAVMFVDVSQRPHGLSSRLHLSLAATIRAGATVPEPLGDWADWPVLSLLDRFVGEEDRLRQAVVDFMAAQLSTDDFELRFKARFIRRVPIADRIAVDSDHQRLIVPIDAERLRLADGSRVLVELTAPFCKGNLERCTLVLASRGPVYGEAFQNQLQCELIERRDCCTKEAWTAELAEQIARAVPGSVHVFLDAAHRHCPYGVSQCSGESGLFRQPGGP